MCKVGPLLAFLSSILTLFFGARNFGLIMPITFGCFRVNVEPKLGGSGCGPTATPSCHPSRSWLWCTARVIEVEHIFSPKRPFPLCSYLTPLPANLSLALAVFVIFLLAHLYFASPTVLFYMLLLYSRPKCEALRMKLGHSAEARCNHCVVSGAFEIKGRVGTITRVNAPKVAFMTCVGENHEIFQALTDIAVAFNGLVY